MAGSLNRAFIIGNLGKDPEAKHFEGGGIVANFSVATTESYKDKNGDRQENTQWHNIVLWSGLAEIAEKYLKKGDKVFIEGRIRTRQWQDDSGSDRYTTEIIGSNMTMLGGKRDGNPSSTPSQESSKPTTEEPTSNEEENDLPF